MSLSRSSSILLNLLANLLAPMFLPVTGGDARLAYVVAVETINDYRAVSKADLIAIAQIVVFGLGSVVAAVASVGKGLTPDMMLRMQRNALGFERASERKRKALGKYGKGFVAEAVAEAEAAAARAETEAAANADAALYFEAAELAAQAAATVEAACVMPDAEHGPYAMPETAKPEAPAASELEDISNEPPLFPNQDAIRMLEEEAEARLRNPATGPAFAPPPNLFSRRTPSPEPAGNPARDAWPQPPSVGARADAPMLPSIYETERRPQSVEHLRNGTQAAIRSRDSTEHDGSHEAQRHGHSVQALTRNARMAPASPHHGRT